MNKPQQHQKDHTPKLELAPGARLLVRLGWGTDNNSDEIPAELIGCLHYEYIILRFTPNPGLLARLVPGSQAKVRFLHDGVASEFNASVITHITRPSLLVFLTYPSSMNNLNFRQFKRVHSALPGVLVTQGGELPGSISDMSLGGCQLVIDARGKAAARQLEGGQKGVLRFCLDVEGACTSTACTLKNVEAGQFYVYTGLAFDEPTKEFQRRLSAYLDMVQLAP